MSQQKFRALKGFNTEIGERFEIGAEVDRADLTDADMQELTNAEAIVEIPVSVPRTEEN